MQLVLLYKLCNVKLTHMVFRSIEGLKRMDL